MPRRKTSPQPKAEVIKAEDIEIIFPSLQPELRGEFIKQRSEQIFSGEALHVYHLFALNLQLIQIRDAITELHESNLNDFIKTVININLSDYSVIKAIGIFKQWDKINRFKSNALDPSCIKEVNDKINEIKSRWTELEDFRNEAGAHPFEKGPGNNKISIFSGKFKVYDIPYGKIQALEFLELLLSIFPIMEKHYPGITDNIKEIRFRLMSNPAVR